MRWFRPAPRQAPVVDLTQDAGVNESRGIEFAWRVHSATTDWTAKVDTKASIVLGFGGVLIGFLISLSAKGRVLGGLQGWQLLLERIGVGVIALGAILAAFVVLPRLGRRKTWKTWKSNLIYFGHLRHWSTSDLQAELLGLTEKREVEMLSNQLVATSQIAWRKHRLLQLSMVTIFIGVIIVMLAALTGLGI